MLVGHALIAAAHYLLHRRIIVGSDDGLDVVFAVFLLGRAHALEHHATRHGVGARDIGVVETLDVVGELGQLQLGLQLLHQARLLLLRVELFSLFEPVKLVLTAVHFRQLEQMALVAPLRHGEGDVAELPRQFERHYYFACRALKTLANLGNGVNEQLFARFIELTLIFKGETLVDGAVLYMNIIDVRVARRLVVNNAENIDIGNGVAHHLAAAHEALEQHIAPLDLLGLLELERCRQLLHLLIQQLAQLARIALEDFACLADTFHIIIVALTTTARRTTIMNVVFEARLVFTSSDAFGGNREMALARLVNFAD